MSITRVRAPRKSPAERSDDIRRAAIRVALDDGLHGISLRRIGTEAGVAPSLVSHYEPTVDALIGHTFAAIVAAELTEIALLLATVDGPVDQLRFVIDTLMQGGRDDVTVVWLDAWSLGRRNEHLAAQVRAQMDAWHGVVMEVLDDGLRRGDFSTADPDLVAWQLLGMIDGFNAQAMVRLGARPALRDRVATAIAAALGLEAHRLDTRPDTGLDR